jgi:hypothetical protein
MMERGRKPDIITVLVVDYISWFYNKFWGVGKKRRAKQISLKYNLGTNYKYTLEDKQCSLILMIPQLS